MHNDRTGHFHKLLLHAVAALGRKDKGTSAANALHLSQVVLKFAAEHLTIDRLPRLLAEPAPQLLGGASHLLRVGAGVSTGSCQVPSLAVARCSLGHSPTLAAGAAPPGGTVQHVMHAVMNFVAEDRVTCVAGPVLVSVSVVCPRLALGALTGCSVRQFRHLRAPPGGCPPAAGCLRHAGHAGAAARAKQSPVGGVRPALGARSCGVCRHRPAERHRHAAAPAARREYYR